MNTVTRLASFALLLTIVACTGSISDATPACGTVASSRTIYVGDGDWRSATLARLESAAADSLMLVAFRYADAPTENDTSEIETFGGRVVYRYESFPALNVEISVEALRRILLELNNERLISVHLGSTGGALGC